MNYKLIIAALFTVVFLSCSSGTEQADKANTMKEQPQQADETNKFKDVAFDSKKDLVCGMPVTAGVSDTSHYDGKVYGFCSKECKDEFVKKPATFITQK